MSFQTRLFLLPLLLTAVLASCGAPATPAGSLQLAPESALSDKILQTAPEVRDAYRFALANRDTLRYIPCYCGCGAEGHRSNYDCYIQQVQPDGQAVFRDHALTWGICVDITRDVMHMLEQGQSLADIRAAIDRDYGRFGPSTATDAVP